MKNISLKLWFATALICALPVVCPAAEFKIGAVNMRKVFDGYWKTKQADASLKDFGAELDKERKALFDDYTKAQEDYKKILESANDPAVSTEERERRKKNAEVKLRDIGQIEQNVRQFDRVSMTQLDEKKATVRNNIVSEIREVINSKQKGAGFTIIIDSSSENINQTPVFPYVDPKYDITDEILTQMNSTAPAGALISKPDTKAADPKSTEKK
jgi:Skp family chaperone for outer membrane proteins